MEYRRDCTSKENDCTSKDETLYLKGKSVVLQRETRCTRKENNTIQIHLFQYLSEILIA
jgi:hypothetical protein